MNSMLLAACLVLPGAAQDYGERERHPLAPSLPVLTKAELKKIDDIIERFIQYDIGKLRGAAGKKALDDFNGLGSEAIFNLIEGLNRAAGMESSCPAVIIAKKVHTILARTQDLELLAFARETIGAGVTAKRHLGVLKDLHFSIILRRGALQRQALAGGGGAKSLGSLPLADLERTTRKESGTKLKMALTEAEKRQGARAITILLMGVDNSDASIAKLSQGLLAKNLKRQPTTLLKGLLQHDRAEVRIAAADAVAAKKLRYGAELIALLQDGDDAVRQAGRRALIAVAGGIDHGPAVDASFAERETAIARWRAWWSKQK